MSQLKQITLKDGTTDVVFLPSGIDSMGVATLSTNSGTIVADKQLSNSVRLTSERRKTLLKLNAPAVVNETVNGVSRVKLERTGYIRVETDFSKLATREERQTALNLAVAALKDALFADTIVNNETIY